MGAPVAKLLMQMLVVSILCWFSTLSHIPEKSQKIVICLKINRSNNLKWPVWSEWRFKTFFQIFIAVCIPTASPSPLVLMTVVCGKQNDWKSNNFQFSQKEEETGSYPIHEPILIKIILKGISLYFR